MIPSKFFYCYEIKYNNTIQYNAMQYNIINRREERGEEGSREEERRETNK